MLPPIDDSVLQNNPDFATLYQVLTTSILNPDGSSRHDPGHKEREAIREELYNHRLTHTKNSILVSALSSIVPSEPSSQRRKLSKPSGSSTRHPRDRNQTSTSTSSSQSQTSSSLPPDLLELLLLLPPILEPQQSSSATPSDLSLLFSLPPLSTLPQHIPALSSLLTTTLCNHSVHLSRIASPSTNPSYIHRVIPTLPSLVASQTTTLATLKSSLSATRLACLQQTIALLAQHALILVALAKSLDAKHSLVSRHLELDALVISLESRLGEQSAVSALRAARKTVYTPEAMRALKTYATHLRDARGRVEESIRTLETELASYGVGVEGMEQKERTMKEVARVYRDMGRQIEEVSVDLERLKGS